ncbi:hypothetical protein Nhal_0948 [Nitrosococcus halophilus Nc 4]|uniref:Uncharacterized protein n=1 Tax=Nitrosococcus halophilus (strain Nc4) TaxID=472759 RepID=D5BYD8_NITHN|nr:hypothetical protein [Nitrosococcus halophilus]ADE14121.1 hypothetical protein Nhal_0948 [Nitrosococcus halophilus Nc 4]
MDGHLTSQGTIKTLEDLLGRAREGQLIGVAFVGILRGRRPIKGFSGHSAQDPYFTMGVMQGLSEDLLARAKTRRY